MPALARPPSRHILSAPPRSDRAAGWVRRFPRAVTAAAIRGRLVSAGGAEPALADQDDPRLEGLFRRLQSTSDAAEARVVEQRIWRVWLEAEDAGLNRLMHQGIAAMRDQRYDKALQVFDRMV